jgi:hypothetical protein
MSWDKQQSIAGQEILVGKEFLSRVYPLKLTGSDNGII